MDCSTPGFPVLLYLLEFAQTHGHPTISSSVSSSSSCPQSFPASGSFPMCWLFASGVQSIGASASVLPVIFRVDFLQDWLVGSPCSPRGSQECSPTPQFKNINSLLLSLLYGPTLIPIYDYWKNLSFDYTDLCHKVMSLLFNMLSGLSQPFFQGVSIFISWLQPPSAVILEPKKIKSTSFHFSPSICQKGD